jgi:HAD superfamily phosphoserine phosphatase-like hydrolase
MTAPTTAFCFDLDGVVTSQELLPLIAEELGYYEEMKALTDATIKGVIPFESSFRLRCRILSDVPINRVREIVRQVCLHPRIVSFLHSHTDNAFIITGNLDVWIADLLRDLRVGCYSSIGIIDGDKLTGVQKVLNKGDAVNVLRQRFDRIVAVGDGMGDVTMFEKADVRIAFGAVHPPIESLVQLSDFLCFSEEALCQTLNTLS